MPAGVRQQLTYMIVGDGPHRAHLEKLAEDMELKDVVHFHGKVTTQIKTELLDMADIYVMPSRESRGSVEGLGISFIEADARACL